MANNIILYNESMDKKGWTMNDLLFSGLIKIGLVVLSFLMYLWAQVSEGYNQGASIFEEAAKYGFAVMFLLIVVYIIYREYKDETRYSKQLNADKDSIIKDYHQAFERNTATQEQLIKMMEQHDKNANERNRELIKAIQEFK